MGRKEPSRRSVELRHGHLQDFSDSLTAKCAEIVKSEVQLRRISLPRTRVDELALRRSWRLSDRARDRDHSNPESPLATLSPWNPGRRSEASESVEARR